MHGTRRLTDEALLALRAVPVSDEMPNRLRVAMAMTNANQTEVTRATGFAQAYVSDVERGRYRTITVDNAHKFAEFFGCSIADLFPARTSANHQEVA
jgi:transcriptional regulator with XRE-family HTH domain